jgi:hypothetical protein
MAIFHLNTSTISRKSGRTSTAAAAYRCGGILYDERTDKTHDYTNKKGVVFSECFMFEKGEKVYLDRQRVWNTAEKVEKRIDARTAREIIINLPYELDEINRAELVQEFTEYLAKNYNVAIDFAIHEPSKDGDQRNHHAHILMTTRTATLGENNSLVLGEKTNLELSNTKLGKLGLPKTQDQIINLRERWATMANDYLEFSHIDDRIDHRSYAEQGIDKLPTKKLGSKTVQAERDDIQTPKGDYNRLVFEINVKREELKLYERLDIRLDRSNIFIEQADKIIVADEQRSQRNQQRIIKTNKRIESSKQRIDSTERKISEYFESINRPKPIAPTAPGPITQNTPTPPVETQVQKQAERPPIQLVEPIKATDRKVIDLFNFKCFAQYFYFKNMQMTASNIKNHLANKLPIFFVAKHEQDRLQREIEPNVRTQHQSQHERHFTSDLQQTIYDSLRYHCESKTTHEINQEHPLFKDYTSLKIGEFTAKYKLKLDDDSKADIESRHQQLTELEKPKDKQEQAEQEKPQLTPTATNAQQKPKPSI